MTHICIYAHIVRHNRHRSWMSLWFVWNRKKNQNQLLYFIISAGMWVLNRQWHMCICYAHDEQGAKHKRTKKYMTRKKSVKTFRYHDEFSVFQHREHKASVCVCAKKEKVHKRKSKPNECVANRSWLKWTWTWAQNTNNVEWAKWKHINKYTYIHCKVHTIKTMNEAEKKILEIKERKTRKKQISLWK